MMQKLILAQLVKSCNNITNPLSENKWAHVSIRYTKDTELEVIANKIKIFRYNIAHISIFSEWDIYVHSYLSNALWKYHEYKYYVTRRKKNLLYLALNMACKENEPLCLSFFVNHAESFTLRLIGYQEEIYSELYNISQDYTRDKWVYRTFNTHNLNGGYYHLYILKINEDDDIFFRDFLIHKSCANFKNGNDFRFSTNLFLPHNEVKQGTCTSLLDKTTQLQIKSSPQHNISESEEKYLTCQRVYNSSECPHRIICDSDNDCYCALGRFGEKCNSECTIGTYGFNCKKECGHCKYKDCNKSTGVCPHGCEENFIGGKCEQTSLPILTSIDGIQSNCVDACTIILYNDELNYKGQQLPQYYYARLYFGIKNKATPMKLISDNKVIFSKLDKNTFYTYDIVLCVANQLNSNTCYDNNLRLFNFTTTCKEIEGNQINIFSQNHITTINVTDYDQHVHCDFNEYSYEIIDNETKRSIVNQKMSSTVELKINNQYQLRCYSNYTFHLTRNRTIKFTKQFQTEENKIEESSIDAGNDWIGRLIGYINNMSNTWYIVVSIVLLITSCALAKKTYCKKDFKVIYTPVTETLSNIDGPKDSVEQQEYIALHPIYDKLTCDPNSLTPCICSKKIEVNEFSNYLKLNLSNDHPIHNQYSTLVESEDLKILPKPVFNNFSSNPEDTVYIKSPLCEKAFIASRGPKTETSIESFWQMIIDESVANIVALNNLIEAGTEKLIKYWPDVKQTLTFKKFTVQCNALKHFPYHDVRHFIIAQEDNYSKIELRVQQIQFTAWPRYDLPVHSQIFVQLVKTLAEIEHNRRRPILIHCSDGIGRTGTVILIDNCLRLAKRDNAFDIFYEFYLLRTQKAGMITNLMQYKIVHLVLLESLASPVTANNCSIFEKQYSSMNDMERMQKVEEQIKYVQDTQWRDTFFDPEALSDIETVEVYNRYQEIVPQRYGAIYLRLLEEGDYRYINAVHVDGISAHQNFMVTQHPLQLTIDDFWRLIILKETQLVVSLQPTYDVQFWKNKGELRMLYGSVQHLTEEKCDHCTVHTLELRTSKDFKKIRLIEMEGWPVGDQLPTDIKVLLSTWEQMQKVLCDKTNTLVVCRDGATASGLFVGMSLLFERMMMEQICDVCQTVRSIRRSRRQFVASKEQFRLLNELAMAFLQKFTGYSNFISRSIVN